MEKLLRVASPLGLYAEEFDTSTAQPPGELPTGLLPPGADRGRRAHHPRRAHRGDLVSDSYDVIIIGSGRGRRHARAPPCPLRQAHPAAGARRLAAPRAAELVGRRRVRREPLRLSGHVVRRGRQALPAAGALLRGRRDQALRRGSLPLPQRGLLRAPPPRRDLARLADLLRGYGALLHQGRAALSGARRARRGSDRTARQRALPLPSRLARAPHRSSSPRTSRRRDCTRSTRPAA